MDRLYTALKENSKKIDIFFKKKLPKFENNNIRLVKAVEYSVLGSGKKIRSFLVNETSRLICIANDNEFTLEHQKQAMVVATALEAIHSYSLIHDDLPSMDNSDFRRGKKSTHKEYDEATAILAGDALQSFAFELLSNPKNIYNSNVRSEIIYQLSKYIGMNGLAGGQQADIDFNLNNVTINDIYWIQEKKTGFLIQACVKLACILNNSTQKQMSCLINYAKNLGLAFQIADDLLDVNGKKEKLGKSLNQDLNNNTPNFVNFLGVEQAEKMSSLIVEKAIKYLKLFGENAENLILLAKYSIKRDV